MHTHILVFVCGGSIDLYKVRLSRLYLYKPQSCNYTERTSSCLASYLCNCCARAANFDILMQLTWSPSQRHFAVGTRAWTMAVNFVLHMKIVLRRSCAVHSKQRPAIFWCQDYGRHGQSCDIILLQAGVMQWLGANLTSTYSGSL